MRIPTAAMALLVILFFCVCLCGHIFVVSCLCLKDQRSLLLQFKSDFNYSQLEHSTKLVSWNQSIACCEWSGVACDDEGHVIGLDLSGDSISGGLPNSSTLFSLQHLQKLNLANNSFDSDIPFGFNKLENLTYLNLSDAGFVGQIPSDISHMKRLVTLDISSGFVFAVLKLEKPNLRDLVRNLINMRRLYLDGVNVSAKGEEWSAALLQIPSLQELSMSDCNLSGPLESFPTRLENLSVIRLDRNNFLSPMPETFANLKNLTTLSLGYCRLTGMFPQKIFQVPTLSFIDISNNLDLNGFFPEFPLNAYLKGLKVCWTNFSGSLPNSIGNLRNLSTLDLSHSQFNGTLPNALSNLTQLVELDLSSNRFGGPIPSFTLCEKLEGLSLDYNQLTGKIPSSIFVSTGIKVLGLSNNHLEGHIPTSLFQLRQLEVLRLSSNKFSGTIDFNMISKLRNLDELDLSNNNLSFIDATTSSSNFSLFPTLSRLGLASSNLTTFPQFLKNQSSLYDLDLSNNHIVGIVPKWIANLKHLDQLNLSYNYLTHWEEPRLLNNMSFLRNLDVHSNQLQGSLPALPPSVGYLDYSSNNLSSFIPPNIGNYLSDTSFLSFSSNKLNGNIPESICNIGLLEVLDLSNNVLTGTIPKCLIAMNGTLAVLDLARNKLDGTIDTFPGTCGLTSLHLNDNSLQGKIPEYLAHCAMLEVLDLGNNQIHDHFPCWLKSISTLRVLVLRSNKLHGFLKCQVAWPHLQILDLASNDFSGRVPLSFFENWKAMMIDENHAGLSKPDYLQYGGYYHDRVTVTSKQQQMPLVKILTIFTAVDLSCNKFEGLIPEELGQLNALHILNLSHNVFSGHIPSSLGNMKNLESLDLSSNKLSGEIPVQLALLSFLEYLNLSYNHLEGRIPTSTQIQLLEAASFKGNDGLCGPPLTQNCSGDEEKGTSPPASSSNTDKESSIDWNFLSIELGVIFGIGIIVLPLIFCKSWRIWYWKHVDNMLYRIFPQLDFVDEYHGGRGYRTLRWTRY